MMKNKITTIFIIVIARLNLADSFIPSNNTKVHNNTINADKGDIEIKEFS